MNAMSRRLLLWLVLLPIVITLITWHVVWRISNARAVARLEKTARDQGLPMNLEELAASYPAIPESSNAYVALRNIWALENPELWDGFDRGGRSLTNRSNESLPKGLPSLGRTRGKINPSEQIDSESLKITEDFVNTKSQRVSSLRDALKRPGFRAPIQFQDGYEALLPYLAQMKQDAMLFQLKAVSAIEAARTDEALDCVEDIGRAGHCLKTDPLFIGQLVRLALYTMAIDTSERLVSKQSLNDAQLLRLSSIIEGLQCMDGLKRALAGERAIFFGFFDSPERTFLLSQDPPASDPENAESPEQSAAKSAQGMKLFGVVGMTAAEKRLMGETIEQAIACSEAPGFAATDQFNSLFENASASGRKFPQKLLSSMILPSYSKGGAKFSRTEAIRRCALAALAVERYRLRHDGTLPDTLADVPPEILNTDLQDPFSKQPLHYKKLSPGFVIYSVGQDHKDNDGLITIPPKGKYPPEMDIGFAVERAEKR